MCVLCMPCCVSNAAILNITTAFPVVSPISITGETVVSGYVRLTCSGSGDPVPLYTWYRQDENGKIAVMLKKTLFLEADISILLVCNEMTIYIYIYILKMESMFCCVTSKYKIMHWLNYFTWFIMFLHTKFTILLLASTWSTDIKSSDARNCNYSAELVQAMYHLNSHYKLSLCKCFWHPPCNIFIMETHRFGWFGIGILY